MNNAQFGSAASASGGVGGGVTSGFKVDFSRGQRVGRVYSEWFSRPDDERYLSLSELYGAVRSWADQATVRTVESRAVRVEASRDNAEWLAMTFRQRHLGLLRPTIRSCLIAAWRCIRTS